MLANERQSLQNERSKLQKEKEDLLKEIDERIKKRIENWDNELLEDGEFRIGEDKVILVGNKSQIH